MANMTLGFGVAFLALGIAAFLATGAQHATALIPAGLGIVLIMLGMLARRPRLRMHAMHGAALVALVGFAGSVTGIGQLARMLSGEAIARPPAAIARSVMAILCLAFVALTVRSFVAARIARRRSSEGGV